jgi:hypothetical protein
VESGAVPLALLGRGLLLRRSVGVPVASVRVPVMVVVRVAMVTVVVRMTVVAGLKKNFLKPNFSNIVQY